VVGRSRWGYLRSEEISRSARGKDEEEEVTPPGGEIPEGKGGAEEEDEGTESAWGEEGAVRSGPSPLETTGGGEGTGEEAASRSRSPPLEASGGERTGEEREEGTRDRVHPPPKPSEEEKEEEEKEEEEKEQGRRIHDQARHPLKPPCSVI
jgi:hypothetical protein